MRMVGVLVLALCAACEQSGVQFVVYVPADYGDGPDADREVELPDEVRLFVGLGDETPTQLSPEAFYQTEKRSGTYWLRDPSNVPDIDRAPIGLDAPATFSFLRSGDVDELGVVVAVGYTRGVPTSSAAVFHARLGTGTINRYQMGLNGAADPRDRSLRGRVNQLEVWGADECVHLDNRRSDIQDAAHRVAFIVGSAEDRDCDGLPEGTATECDPEAYLGQGVAQAPSCLYQETAGSACTVGAAQCKDGVSGNDGTCNRTRFCAPPGMCVECKPTADSWECAQDLQLHNTGSVGPYGLDCVIPAWKPVAAENELCEAGIRIEIVPPQGTTCQAVAVKAAGDPAFSDRFHLSSVGASAGIKVTAQGCHLTLEPKGTVVGATSALHYGALMLVALDQGGGLGVPVHVHVVPSTGPMSTACNVLGSCTWLDEDPAGNPDECVLRP